MSTLTDHITVDSWSIGCVLMDILFMEHLFSGVDKVDKLKSVLAQTGIQKPLGYCFVDYFKKKFPGRKADLEGMILCYYHCSVRFSENSNRGGSR